MFLLHYLKSVVNIILPALTYKDVCNINSEKNHLIECVRKDAIENNANEITDKEGNIYFNFDVNNKNYSIKIFSSSNNKTIRMSEHLITHRLILRIKLENDRRITNIPNIVKGLSNLNSAVYYSSEIGNQFRLLICIDKKPIVFIKFIRSKIIIN